MPQLGSLQATGISSSPTACSMELAPRSRPRPHISANSPPVDARRRPSAPMGWIFCAGSASSQRSGSIGTRRRESRPGTSAAGCAVAPKQLRPHWRRRDHDAPPARQQPAPNALTGKAAPGPRYAQATVAHAESVLRAFYDFHLEEGTGPMVNPFPLAAAPAPGAGRRAPQPPRAFRGHARGRYRPKLTEHVPRVIPDERLRRAVRRAVLSP